MSEVLYVPGQSVSDGRRHTEKDTVRSSCTKLYKNKILGLRGKATGLIFPNFDRKKHVYTCMDKRQLKTEK